MKSRRPKSRRPAQILHYELKEGMNAGSIPFWTITAFAAIAYMVRTFSYSEAGPLYAMSAVLSLTGLYLFLAYIPSIYKGRRQVMFRRSYAGIHSVFSYYKFMIAVSMGVFMGNVAYYSSRSRIWGESGELLNVVLHLMNPIGLGLGFAIFFAVTYYLFWSDDYISSAEYTNRIRSKCATAGLTERTAFVQLIEEQDNYHEFGAYWKDEGPASINREKKPGNEEDIYASVRVRRGE